MDSMNSSAVCPSEKINFISFYILTCNQNCSLKRRFDEGQLELHVDLPSISLRRLIFSRFVSLLLHVANPRHALSKLRNLTIFLSPAKWTSNERTNLDVN